ncbi:cyclohexadieny/prephenate dehydrogenase [Constrictibacter sp. MBR-5]|jgi:cyclohexadieny/prephenate dehydrogenase|uniref:prephenate/arogenate dehydrogenase family protein n=1 Tax=Constrictibacter sp. MBR-5 TaxID=3156467 RepID=UPI00339556C6
MADKPVFDRIALIGIGLIGSSLARAIRRGGLAGHVVACDSSEEVLASVERLGFADSTTSSVPEAVRGADLVVVCTPVGTFADIGAAMRPALSPGAIVSDTGSVKQCVVRDLGPCIPEGVHFVPGHPIAGTEHSGPEAGFAELFDGRWCILTPPPGTDRAAVDRLSELWRACGAMIEVMDPGHHDQVLAVTSHLPHLIAFTIVGTASDLGEHLQQEVVQFAASGFRDFTRIAASDPIMWRDIFLNNRDALLEVSQRMQEDLARLQRAIRWGEGEEIEQRIRRTREIRRRLIDAKQA